MKIHKSKQKAQTLNLYGFNRFQGLPLQHAKTMVKNSLLVILVAAFNFAGAQGLSFNLKKKGISPFINQIEHIPSPKKDSLGFFEPSPTLHKGRLIGLSSSAGALYVGSMIGLNSLWYKDYPRSKFHFFNDNAEWLQMDKGGHMITSYYIGKYGIDLFKWTGMERKKAIWIGGSLGSVFQTTIEILDGFSSQWGASPGDLLANTMGSAIVITQALLWDEQRLVFRYSYHWTEETKYRPNLLGSNWQERWIKDYNGQTYWLSANIHSFLGNESSRFPRWLNVAVGYGAQGMIGGTENPIEYNGQVLPHFTRYRQYYLALDIELGRIKTKSKLLKTLFNAVVLIKIPAPTLEYNSVNGFKFHPLYF